MKSLGRWTSIPVRTLTLRWLRVTLVLLSEENMWFRFPVFLSMADRQHRLRTTLRSGTAMARLLVGPRTPLEVTTSEWVLVRVLVERGRRIVTRLLLKLVPKVV